MSENSGRWLFALKLGDMVVLRDGEGGSEERRVIAVTLKTVRLDNGRIYRPSDGRAWGFLPNDRERITGVSAISVLEGGEG